MKRSKTKGPTAIELALHKLAQRLDVGLPQTDEEIVKMLNSQDLSNVPKPDPARFERLIQERLQRQRQEKTPDNVVPMPVLPAVVPAHLAVPPQVRALAYAARHGKKLTPAQIRKVAEAIEKAQKGAKRRPENTSSEPSEPSRH